MNGPEPRPYSRVTITVETHGHPTEVITLPKVGNLDFGVKYLESERDPLDWVMAPSPPVIDRFEFSCKPRPDEANHLVYVTKQDVQREAP